MRWLLLLLYYSSFSRYCIWTQESNSWCSRMFTSLVRYTSIMVHHSKFLNISKNVVYKIFIRLFICICIIIWVSFENKNLTLTIWQFSMYSVFFNQSSCTTYKQKCSLYDALYDCLYSESIWHFDRIYCII